MEQLRVAHATRRIPAATRRSVARERADANYSGQTFKHILLPIWLLGYSYGARKFQVVINGHTGEIAGDYPKSWVKITLAVLIALIVVLIIAFIASHK